MTQCGEKSNQQGIVLHTYNFTEQRADEAVYLIRHNCRVMMPSADAEIIGDGAESMSAITDL
ncbi:hypothetical protein BIY28_20245 [Brenneria goodwinii]|nr:hypothetical protein BIY28_20245 [Brenneria goodwinii]